MFFRNCFERSRSTPSKKNAFAMSPSETTATEMDDDSSTSSGVDLFFPISPGSLEKEKLTRSMTEETVDSSVDYSEQGANNLNADPTREALVHSSCSSSKVTEPQHVRPNQAIHFRDSSPRDLLDSSLSSRDALDSSLSSSSDRAAPHHQYARDDFGLSSGSESDSSKQGQHDALESSLSSAGSEQSSGKQVSFEDEVSVRVYSDHSPRSSSSRSSRRPPRAPTFKSRQRVVSYDDQILCKVEETDDSESTCRQVNTSPYLDSLSERVDDLKHVLVQRQIKYGTKHPWTGHVWLYVGGYYFGAHKFKQAEHAFLQAAGCDEGEHPNVEGGYIVAEAFSNLGVIYWNTGDTAKAVQSLELALTWHETNETARGREPDACLAIAHCLDKLSMACTLHGSLSKAKRALVHCAHIHYQIGSDRLEFARILDRLGMVHMHDKHVDDAMSCFSKALHEKQQVGGKHHPSLVSTYQHIATIHMTQEKYKDAENVLLYALLIQDLEWKKKRKQKNQATRLCYEMAETLQSLGQAFRAQDKLERCYKTIVDARRCYLEAGLEPDHMKLKELHDLEHNLVLYKQQVTV